MFKDNSQKIREVDYRDQIQIAGALLEYMTRYSTPKRVKSDREFLFEAVQEVCNVFVITSVNTSSYKVQSIRKKKEARDVIKHFKVQAELQTGTRLLRLMTDR